MDFHFGQNYREQIDPVFSAQQSQALKLRNSSKAERISLLQKMLDWIGFHQEDIRKALYADFKKPFPETDLTEIFLVTSEINHAIKNLGKWMNPKKVPTPIPLLGSISRIQYEPKGTALIIAPWNYPFNLALGPLVSAIAAGCTAIIKPSELTPHTASLIKRLAEEVFDHNTVAVFEGEIALTQHLLSKPFDHIFFTGSPIVGKIIMKAAADHLSSVTLELGGKSPAIVDRLADLKDAAAKIAWGKYLNCGQTCVAPDYILVDEAVKEPFLEALKVEILKMYNPKGQGIEKSKDYARIVNQKHLKRLAGLLADAQAKGAKTIFGGSIIENDNYIEPTVLADVRDDMMVMQEEVFGPILPVMTFTQLDGAISYINGKPKALSLYIFTKDKQTADQILQQTSSGGVVINDCAIHFFQNELPFGGVNHSGLGKAHGHFGFLAFSNEKAVLQQRVGMTSVKPLFPPYGFTAQKVIKGLLKWF